ncbi:MULTISPECIES: hypothetical protein [unclassified Streptomyces]|uniref:hypothetical protein n=1 Tax=Streptomyces TaxID=1883 RepID=UPI0010129B8A|nr:MULTISPECIES: hypothetical protein [unclassified Streptomyces]MDT0425596.1 hypothetical protein [Streptomyces sp. DSM 41859]NJA61007.1 hypothetical protein [Streptomyces sp. NEAU-H3]WEH27007.1 hypothetical protein P0D76_06520 [Streptomyces sp. AM 3-1-1]
MAAWTWRFENGDGAETQPAVQPEEFTTQGDAESWLGEQWRALLAGGTDRVHLLEEDKLVYGPLSLSEAAATDVSEPALTADEETAVPGDTSQPPGRGRDSQPVEPGQGLGIGGLG